MLAEVIVDIKDDSDPSVVTTKGGLLAHLDPELSGGERTEYVNFYSFRFDNKIQRKSKKIKEDM